MTSLQYVRMRGAALVLIGLLGTAAVVLPATATESPAKKRRVVGGPGVVARKDDVPYIKCQASEGGPWKFGAHGCCKPRCTVSLMGAVGSSVTAACELQPCSSSSSPPPLLQQPSTSKSCRGSAPHCTHGQSLCVSIHALAKGEPRLTRPCLRPFRTACCRCVSCWPRMPGSKSGRWPRPPTQATR